MKVTRRGFFKAASSALMLLNPLTPVVAKIMPGDRLDAKPVTDVLSANRREVSLLSMSMGHRYEEVDVTRYTDAQSKYFHGRGTTIFDCEFYWEPGISLTSVTAMWLQGIQIYSSTAAPDQVVANAGSFNVSLYLDRPLTVKVSDMPMSDELMEAIGLAMDTSSDRYNTHWTPTLEVSTGSNQRQSI